VIGASVFGAFMPGTSVTGIVVASSSVWGVFVAEASVIGTAFAGADDDGSSGGTSGKPWYLISKAFAYPRTEVS
jgi:hypothetical protein